jgi:hypothetical protein
LALVPDGNVKLPLVVTMVKPVNVAILLVTF